MKQFIVFGKTIDQIKKEELERLMRHNISASFIISYSLFLMCWLLDYYLTHIGANGDWAMEGNGIARIWWQVMGPLRHIELILWPLAAFGITFIASARNAFVGLLWINIIAFNHFFGFITWLPYGSHTLLDNYRFWASDYPIGLMSITVSIPVAIIQSHLMPTRLFRRKIISS
jgi:hypothetical protein